MTPALLVNLAQDQEVWEHFVPMLRRIIIAVYALGLCYLLTWIPFIAISQHADHPAFHRTIFVGYAWVISSPFLDTRWSVYPDVTRIVLRVLAWTAFCVAAFLIAQSGGALLRHDSIVIFIARVRGNLWHKRPWWVWAGVAAILFGCSLGLYHFSTSLKTPEVNIDFIPDAASKP